MGDGKSCDEICAANFGTCSAKDFYIDTASTLNKICRKVGYNPTGNLKGVYDIRPVYCDSTRCYGYGERFSCSVKDTHSTIRQCARICPCLLAGK